MQSLPFPQQFLMPALLEKLVVCNINILHSSLPSLKAPSPSDLSLK